MCVPKPHSGKHKLCVQSKTQNLSFEFHPNTQLKAAVIALLFPY